jgi:hypothetical protein
LSEAAPQSPIVASDSDCATKREEAKRKLEADQRTIFGLAADHFSQFFNPQEAIDENSFKAVLAKAKIELGRLTSSDVLIRKTVGASPSQDTADAVAQLASNQL